MSSPSFERTIGPMPSESRARWSWLSAMISKRAAEGRQAVSQAPERETPRKHGALATPGQGLEPQIRHPECRVLPITPSRIGAPRIVNGPAPALRPRAGRRPAQSAAGWPFGAKKAVIASSRPGSSTSRTSSPASMTVSGLGTKPAPPRSTEMIRLPSGRAMSRDLLAHDGRVRRDLELDDLQALLFEREQVHEAVAGHLVLDQAQDQVGGGDRRLDARAA